MRRVLVGSPRYVRGHKPARAPCDLAAWDFVRLNSRPAELTLVSPARKAPLIVPIAARISVDGAAAMRELVLAGAGLAMLPEVLVRSDLARRRLVEVLSDWKAVPLGVYAVWPHNAQPAGLTQRFIEFISSRVAVLLDSAQPQ